MRPIDIACLSAFLITAPAALAGQHAPSVEVIDRDATAGAANQLIERIIDSTIRAASNEPIC